MLRPLSSHTPHSTPVTTGLSTSAPSTFMATTIAGSASNSSWLGHLSRGISRLLDGTMSSVMSLSQPATAPTHRVAQQLGSLETGIEQRTLNQILDYIEKHRAGWQEEVERTDEPKVIKASLEEGPLRAVQVNTDGTIAIRVHVRGGNGKEKSVKRVAILRWNDVNEVSVEDGIKSARALVEDIDADAAKNEAEILDMIRGQPHLLQIYSQHVFEKTLADGTVKKKHVTLGPRYKGGDLFDLLKPMLPGRRLPRPIRWKFTRDLIEGVAKLHELGILHLDLKPENILIDQQEGKDDALVIADYGMACLAGNDKARKRSCGTRDYLAPEVLKAAIKSEAQWRTEKNDMWPLGLMLYMLHKGRLPYFQANLGTAKHVGRVAFLDDDKMAENGMPLEPSTPDTLWAIIRDMLRPDPAMRISSAEALERFDKLDPDGPDVTMA